MSLSKASQCVIITRPRPRPLLEAWSKEPYDYLISTMTTSGRPNNALASFLSLTINQPKRPNEIDKLTGDHIQSSMPHARPTWRAASR